MRTYFAVFYPFYGDSLVFELIWMSVNFFSCFVPPLVLHGYFRDSSRVFICARSIY